MRTAKALAAAGLALLVDAKPAAAGLAQFIRSDQGRGILAKHGFDAP